MRQERYLVTWRFADSHVKTFTFNDKEKALWKYSQGKMGGRLVRGKTVPVVAIRAEVQNAK